MTDPQNLRHLPLVIQPGQGIGPFRLGLTRDEIQALTCEPIQSYFAQTSSEVRSDAHDLIGVTVSYGGDGRANHIAGYTRVEHGTSTLEFEGERLSDSTRSSLATLLEQLETPCEDTGETLVAPRLGLTFGFREPDEDHGPDDQCDWVVVCPPLE